MKITKLEYQKNNPNRVNVFVDGEFAVGLDANDILNLKIFTGQEVSQDELNKIISQSEFGKMLNFAINYISFRPRSEWEIIFHLKRKYKIDSGRGQNDIGVVVEKLKKMGLINDLNFSKWFVQQRNTFRPKSKRIMKQELRIKGVDAKIIDEVLNEDKVSDFDKANLLIAKKRLIEKEKIVRFLGTRGFDWDTIKEVLARLKINDYNDSN